MDSEKVKGKLVIFTDLDGTLLDEQYSFSDALDAIAEIKRRRIPLIICSSKTRAEIEFYMKELKLNEPFISENGGGIFIPAGYFSKLAADKKIGKYYVIELGTPYKELRKILKEVQEITGFKIRGFGDMSVEDIIKLTKLNKRFAELSKKREYDEPFVIESSENAEKILKIIEEKGFKCVRGGLFYHLIRGNDKGKAVKILTEIFKENGFSGLTVGLGDSYNDIPMLENVDIPVLIKRRDGFIDFHKENLIKSSYIGPKGWNEVILQILEKFYS